MDPIPLPGALAAIYRLAGCVTPECEKRGTHADAVFEIPLHVLELQFQQFQAAKNQVAEHLGDLGVVYTGGAYVKGTVLQAAADTGLYLDYYKSYNVSKHDPHNYFDTVWDLPAADLLDCNASFFGDSLEFMQSSKMKNYFDWTGDVDGVTEQDGLYRANCQLPAVWIAPAGRMIADTFHS